MEARTATATPMAMPTLTRELATSLESGLGALLVDGALETVDEAALLSVVGTTKGSLLFAVDAVVVVMKTGTVSVLEVFDASEEAVMVATVILCDVADAWELVLAEEVGDDEAEDEEEGGGLMMIWK